MDKLYKAFEEVRAAMEALNTATIDEVRVFTEDEEKTWDELVAKRDTIEKQIERQKSLDADAAAIAHAGESRGTAVGVLAYGATNEPGKITDVRDLQAEKGYANIGEQAVACVRMAKNPTAYETEKRYRAIEERAISGMNEGVPAEGGFYVQSEFSIKMFESVMETSPLAPLCETTEIGAGFNGTQVATLDETSRADGSRWGGILGYWVGEGTAPTKSKPKPKRVELKLEKVAALMYLTDELMADTVALTSEINRLFPKELAWQADKAIVKGDGSAKPLGFKNGGSLISVDKATSQAAATFVSQNVYKMYPRMFPSSLSNATWYITSELMEQVFQLNQAVGTGGTALYIPPAGISAAPSGTLMGRPIVPIEHCEVLGTAGDIYFADLSQYMLIRKGSIESQSSIHVEFTEFETTLRWHLRLNGQPIMTSAITPNNGGPTQSAFVSLAVRA